ncbi:MAG: DUF4436 domain-containing protein [Proteobacteria bacterium]|jgi:hypothetical protein|nr:DUF4436 domain-containing protein [Pseudomonadota bacterium]
MFIKMFKLFSLFVILAFNINSVYVFAAPLNLIFDESKMVININLLKYDPRTGIVSSELSLLPSKHLLAKNYSINRNMEFIDYTNVNTPFHKIDAGEPFIITDFDYFDDFIVNDSGNEFTYPFDTHYFQINYGVYEKIDNDYTSYPLSYTCTGCGVAGYDIKFNDKSIVNKVILDFYIKNNMSTKIIAIVINSALLVMGVLVLIMGIRILKDHKIPEMSALGFAGGLLFAFPAIRNAMPGIPPIGILIDYFGIFPGELCVTISLCILATCWLRRGGHS